jgi:SRSO17 transposase
MSAAMKKRGRIENCQVAVFLSYASAHGRALIERRIYLTQSWIGDSDRCQVGPALALQMITAALHAGITVGLVTGDECYGRDPRLRTQLQERGVAVTWRPASGAVAALRPLRLLIGRLRDSADLHR